MGKVNLCVWTCDSAWHMQRMLDLYSWFTVYIGLTLYNRFHYLSNLSVVAVSILGLQFHDKIMTQLEVFAWSWKYCFTLYSRVYSAKCRHSISDGITQYNSGGPILVYTPCTVICLPQTCNGTFSCLCFPQNSLKSMDHFQLGFVHNKEPFWD